MSTSPEPDETAPVLNLPDVKTVDIDSIIPYWRNPRQVAAETVNAIAQSIERYGYQQPIVVDEENVIIIGHTRYAALRRLGVTDVPVVTAHLPALRVKELRVIDNKAAEYSLWDFEKLQEELAVTDAVAMQGYFDVLEAAESGSASVSYDAGTGSAAGLEDDDEEEPEPDLNVEFACPSCFHSFEKHVTKSQINAGRIA
jgi:hypothetical protein